MEKRIETPFTNEHFAAFCERMLGQPYWYGTTGNIATDNLLRRKTAQYPSHYASNRTARYKRDIQNGRVVCDCIGGCKAYAWTDAGERIIRYFETGETYSPTYGANGCPDRSANGMFSYAKNQGMPNGAISTVPDLPGVALWKDGHVGYTVGGGMAVEWRSFSYGCVRTRISERNWKNWFYLPFINYGEAEARVLRRGMKGEDVREMQNLLINAGYPLPRYGADGDFGKETEDALKAFQAANGLTPDGVYGEKTRAALENVQPVQPEPEPEPQPPETSNTIVIRTNGGRANIRLGNGTDYASVFRADNGATFPYVATAENGWHAVKTDGRVLWVSGDYGFFL